MHSLNIKTSLWGKGGGVYFPLHYDVLLVALSFVAQTCGSMCVHATQSVHLNIYPKFLCTFSGQEERKWKVTQLIKQKKKRLERNNKRSWAQQGGRQQLDGQHSDQPTLLFPSAPPENQESQAGLSETHPHPLHSEPVIVL